jgi:proteasome lid subunit RPN8/RPN11
MTIFGDAVEKAARSHALAAHPKESVGLVVNGEYVPVENIAADPTKDFAINKSLMLKPGLQAIIHSHPSGNHAPSKLDMEQQVATALPWGIVRCNGEDTGPVFWWGPGVPIPPLLGRPYRFGPSGTDGCGDCYAVIKDWYALERGVDLKEVPRDEDSFRAETPWYDTLFAPYGWQEIAAADMRAGDVVLMRIRMNVTNHAMLLLENGKGLHHAGGMLSTETPIGPWLRFRTRCIRYTGAA